MTDKVKSVEEQVAEPHKSNEGDEHIKPKVEAQPKIQDVSHKKQIGKRKQIDHLDAQSQAPYKTSEQDTDQEASKSVRQQSPQTKKQNRKLDGTVRKVRPIRVRFHSSPERLRIRKLATRERKTKKEGPPSIRETVQASELKITRKPTSLPQESLTYSLAIVVDKPPVPSLKHGLERVLFKLVHILP